MSKSLSGNDFVKKKLTPRYSLVIVVFSFFALCIVGKAFYTMSVRRDFWLDIMAMNKTGGRTLPAKRGNILSGDGEVIAASLPEYKAYLDFRTSERGTRTADSLAAARDQRRRDTLFIRELGGLCREMHKAFPDVDPHRLRAHLLKGFALRSKYWPLYPATVTSLPLHKNENRTLTYVEYSRVKRMPLMRVGSTANFEKIDKRTKIYGLLARRTIGEYVDTARYGLEQSFDSILRGRPGRYHLQKVKNRNVQVVDTAAQDGLDVLTTLDVDLQDFVEKTLGEKLREKEAISGVCIVMEVKTGDIKAISSLQRRPDGTYYEDQPLAVTQLYEPGSVFKPMSMLVALDDGVVKMEDGVNVGGGIVYFGNRKMKDHNWRSGGYNAYLDVKSMIKYSSNVAVSMTINRCYASNPGKFVDGLYRIGVHDDLKIPIPGYKRARIRHPRQSDLPGMYWSSTTLPWMSIGYETQVPPIHTITFYNGIANGGRMMRPRLVKGLMHEGELVREYPPVVVRRHMASDYAVSGIKAALTEVVKSGVGKPAGSKAFQTAGKTGTAQVWTSAGKTTELLVSFAGFFPAEDPKYSCMVCIHAHAPAGGGADCGPVFRKVAEAVMARDAVADYAKARDTTQCLSPYVARGDMRAASRVLNALNIGFLSHTRLRDAPEAVQPLWGETSTQGERIELIPLGSTGQTAADPKATLVMPDVTGYGLRDAVYRLEMMGLRVKARGLGRVTAQRPYAGEPLRRGERVELTLEPRRHPRHAPTTQD